MPVATGYDVPLAKSDKAKKHLPLMNIVMHLLNYFPLADGAHLSSSLQVGSTHSQKLEVVKCLGWVGGEETVDESC
jgi:hypothetical protein